MSDLLELQRFLFEKTPTRMELLKYPCQHKNKKVYVFRNHSFELIEKTINAYLDYAGIGIDFSYSNYDDSFSFSGFDNTADCVLIWVDAQRYREIDLSAFFKGRIAELRPSYDGSVIFAVTGDSVSINMNGVLDVDLSLVEEKFGSAFFDLKMEPFTGTRLSQNACLYLSKLFGLKYFPAVLSPAMKAIFVDLDNTLYKGVLGEDGISGIVLTSEHKELQEKLKNLASQGVFLCAVSKNDVSDVKKMFTARNDFPLNVQDFTKISASWRTKSQMIAETLAFLNIGADSALFIDDNIGEISEVSAAFPQIKYILAYDGDAGKTAEILDSFPGFIEFSATKEDGLRKNDVQANEERRKLQETLSHDEFLRRLKMQVRILCNDEAGKKRIAQLAGKTNQFIFNYKRYTLPEIEKLMLDENSVVVSLHLKDNLSDSGMIGALVLKKSGCTAVMEECFISCRALGRGIDDLIVFKAIECGLKKLGINDLQVLFKNGERNEPAQLFFEKYLSDFKMPHPFKALAETDLVSFVYGEEK